MCVEQNIFDVILNSIFLFPFNADQVALPEFAPGGMENWGLALYRETNLLVSDTYTTTQERQRVASIIAHEIDHMV